MSYQISPSKAFPKLPILDTLEVLKHLGQNFAPVAHLSKSRQHSPWLISLSTQFVSVSLIITKSNKLTLGSLLRDYLSQFFFHHYLPQLLTFQTFQRTPFLFTISGSIPINFSYQKNMTHIPYLSLPQPSHSYLSIPQSISFLSKNSQRPSVHPSQIKECSKEFCLHFSYRWKLFPVRQAHQPNPSIISKDNNHTDMTACQAALSSLTTHPHSLHTALLHNTENTISNHPLTQDSLQTPFPIFMLTLQYMFPQDTHFPLLTIPTQNKSHPSSPISSFSLPK